MRPSVPVLLKFSQERFLRKQFLAKVRDALPTHASYFSGEGIHSGFETKVSCPALSQLGCLFPRSALVTCCAVVDPTLPGLLEPFISREISHHFSSDFLPALSHPSAGVLTTKFQSCTPPGLKSSLWRAESCAGRESDLH